TLVTRSPNHREYAGTKIVNYAPFDAQGVAIGKNRKGIAFHWFSRRSDVTGWTISVGVPDSVLNAPARRAFVNFAMAGSILLAAAIGLSYYWGGRLSQSVGALGIDRKPTREEFEVLFESAPNGVMVIAGNGVITLVNARMESQFGYRRAELV